MEEAKTERAFRVHANMILGNRTRVRAGIYITHDSNTARLLERANSVQEITGSEELELHKRELELDQMRSELEAKKARAKLREMEAGLTPELIKATKPKSEPVQAPTGTHQRLGSGEPSPGTKPTAATSDEPNWAFMTISKMRDWIESVTGEAPKTRKNKRDLAKDCHSLWEHGDRPRPKAVKQQDPPAPEHAEKPTEIPSPDAAGAEPAPAAAPGGAEESGSQPDQASQPPRGDGEDEMDDTLAKLMDEVDETRDLFDEDAKEISGTVKEE